VFQPFFAAPDARAIGGIRTRSSRARQARRWIGKQGRRGRTVLPRGERRSGATAVVIGRLHHLTPSSFVNTSPLSCPPWSMRPWESVRRPDGRSARTPRIAWTKLSPDLDGSGLRKGERIAGGRPISMVSAGLAASRSGRRSALSPAWGQNPIRSPLPALSFDHALRLLLPCSPCLNLWARSWASGPCDPGSPSLAPLSGRRADSQDRMDQTPTIA
jgi:hypothetical protein